MSWSRRVFGMDAVDLWIHFGVTAVVGVFVARLTLQPEVLPILAGLSLAVLGVRRSIALRRAGRRGLTTGEMAAERIAELEQRMADLEAAQARVAELEERLDFTERLLARSAEQRGLGPGGPQ